MKLDTLHVKEMLLEWWESEEGTHAREEMEEMLEAVDPLAWEEIDKYLMIEDVNGGEAIYDVLMDEGVLGDDTDIRNSFIDYYDRIESSKGIF